MSKDLEQSLDAHSEWVYLKSNSKVGMEESLVATSEKVFFENASSINRQEFQKDKQIMEAQSPLEPVEESQNEFMEVGKWRKNKQTVQEGEMKSVKEEVQQMITQTKWTKNNETEEVEVGKPTIKTTKKSSVKGVTVEKE